MRTIALLPPGLLNTSFVGCVNTPDKPCCGKQQQTATEVIHGDSMTIMIP